MSEYNSMSKKELLEEVTWMRQALDVTEWMLEMAEDVLGRSHWNEVYRKIIEGDDE